MAAPATRKSRSRERQARVPLPARFEPQLATLVKTPPAGKDWLHEIKFDGYRIGCRIDGQDIRLISRNGKDWSAKLPVVLEAAARLETRGAWIDGEVAVVLPDGHTSFQALQNFFAGGGTGELVYFVFDLLHLDGTDLSRLPLEERKTRLHRLVRRVNGRTAIRYAEDFSGGGPEFFAEACHLGLEGVVSKRRSGIYQAGRSREWLKAKCIRRQEFVIGGFTDPEGSRAGLGALLVGVQHDGKLWYSGKVGTGFTQKSATELRARLEALERKTSPFAAPPSGRLGREAHWVKPSLLAEVTFAEWTGDGKIRHSSFQGLREDKMPDDIVREEPAPQPPASGNPGRKGSAAEVAGVRLTHPERILYPDIGFTKLQLAKLYEGIAEWIMPHVVGRPLTLVRCPKGIGSACFYMKHAHAYAPEPLRRIRIQEKEKTGEYLIADSIAAVVGLVQMDVLELHTWNSTEAHLEQPDRIVLDLDPGPRVAWPQVLEAARLVRGIADVLELKSFVKTTGGHGLHVVVPLAPKATWAECLELARAIAKAIERQSPRRYTTAFPKAGREEKILIDYLRNNRTNTSVVSYSTRARPQAPVSVPLDWDELGPRLRSDHYTVRNLSQRLSRLKQDPWKAYWKCRQKIPAKAVEALAEI